jgi:hypothetical protein
MAPREKTMDLQARLRYNAEYHRWKGAGHHDEEHHPGPHEQEGRRQLTLRRGWSIF